VVVASVLAYLAAINEWLKRRRKSTLKKTIRRTKMGMTITEKIIAAHAQKKKVIPGELVQVKIDLALANDITAPLSIKELEKQKID